MAADDLSAPLGQDTKRQRLKVPVALPAAMAGALGLCIVVFIVWAAAVDDPLGGEPMVVVASDPRGTAPKTPGESAANPVNPGTDPKIEAAVRDVSLADPPVQAKPASPPVQTVTIIDGSSGRRQEVAIPAVGASQRAALVDQRLLETTRHGSIPRVGLDGTRSVVAYARPVSAASAKANMPRIALVVGGLGIGANSTAEALAKLPGPVTVAFAPYGADLDRLTSRARAEGHEILLQLPMEPFDYPDNDPGPQTLLTSLAPEQNIDRMYWLMSRFQGYVGIANYMGARFTANEAALAPTLREVAKRGLLFFDDGTSPRSLAGQIAGANSLPFVKAGVVLDAVPNQAEIDRALARLETMARDNGIAVGVATALPVSIDRLAQWAKKVEARGFMLVPVSAVAVKPKSS